MANDSVFRIEVEDPRQADSKDEEAQTVDEEKYEVHHCESLLFVVSSSSLSSNFYMPNHTFMLLSLIVRVTSLRQGLGFFFQ